MPERNTPAARSASPGLLTGLSQKVEELDSAVARQAERFQAVMEIGTELASTRDVDALLGPVIERLETLLGAEAATLFMYEEDVGELVGRVVHGDALKELRIKADRGVAGHVARTGEALLLADAYGDPRFNPDVDRKSGFKTRSMIAVPLRHVSGRCLGVVQVLHRRVGAFGEEDLALVEAIAAQIAGVLDNLLLMDTLRTQNEVLRRAMDELSVAMRDLDLLYELEQAVHSAEGETELLDRILAKATRLVGAEAGSILFEGRGAQPALLPQLEGRAVGGAQAARP